MEKPAGEVNCKLQDLGGGPESELVVKSVLNEKQSCYGKAQGSKM